MPQAQPGPLHVFNVNPAVQLGVGRGPEQIDPPGQAAAQSHRLGAEKRFKETEAQIIQLVVQVERAITRHGSANTHVPGGTRKIETVHGDDAASQDRRSRLRQGQFTFRRDDAQRQQAHVGRHRFRVRQMSVQLQAGTQVTAISETIAAQQYQQRLQLRINDPAAHVERQILLLQFDGTEQAYRGVKSGNLHLSAAIGEGHAPVHVPQLLTTEFDILEVEHARRLGRSRSPCRSSDPDSCPRQSQAWSPP